MCLDEQQLCITVFYLNSQLQRKIRKIYFAIAIYIIFIITSHWHRLCYIQLLCSTIYWCWKYYFNIIFYEWREHVMTMKWMKSYLRKMSFLWNNQASPLLFSVLVPWRQWMRRLCGRRSCPRWTPHRCPSFPHLPPHIAHLYPLSGGVANCLEVARGAVVVKASPPARLLPPLPSPLRPEEGRWRAAALEGWTGSIPGTD